MESSHIYANLKVISEDHPPTAVRARVRKLAKNFLLLPEKLEQEQRDSTSLEVLAIWISIWYVMRGSGATQAMDAANRIAQIKPAAGVMKEYLNTSKTLLIAYRHWEDDQAFHVLAELGFDDIEPEVNKGHQPLFAEDELVDQKAKLASL